MFLKIVATTYVTKMIKFGFYWIWKVAWDQMLNFRKVYENKSETFQIKDQSSLVLRPGHLRAQNIRAYCRDGGRSAGGVSLALMYNLRNNFLWILHNYLSYFDNRYMNFMGASYGGFQWGLPIGSYPRIIVALIQ